LIGDIAAARSVGTADSASTAAAARHALRMKQGVEIGILFMSGILLPEIRQTQAFKQNCLRRIRAVDVPRMTLEITT
jgi:hypothetical protein